MCGRGGRTGDCCELRPDTARGFTLVEVLVVMGIVALLVALLSPAISKVRAEGRSTQCMSNLRQIYQAVMVYRNGADQLLPYAAPLPAETPTGLVGGLPDALQKIIDKKSEVWWCPEDFDNQENVGLSFVYAAGGFILLEPPDVNQNAWENAKRVMRLVTQRFEGGYLRKFPLVADSEDRHERSGAVPRNGVFLDGTTRPLKKEDGIIDDS
ncbi:MAG TPA: type II secretion system protein [Phycisphaerales bacterium]|nr:type II secretion system protein [Phycisphaerales bacterium]